MRAFDRSSYCDSNGCEITPGCRLVYSDRGQSNVGDVVADPVYRSGMRCNGRSVQNILDESSKVEVLP